MVSRPHCLCGKQEELCDLGMLYGTDIEEPRPLVAGTRVHLLKYSAPKEYSMGAPYVFSTGAVGDEPQMAGKVSSGLQYEVVSARKPQVPPQVFGFEFNGAYEMQPCSTRERTRGDGRWGESRRRKCIELKQQR